jgi:hypothetical protein
MEQGYDLPDPPESCKYASATEIAECRERLKPVLRFDSDAARTFTEKLPTEYWLKAAESSILPPRQRKEIGGRCGFGRYCWVTMWAESGLQRYW